MRRLTLVHESDSHGDDWYRLGPTKSDTRPESAGNTNSSKAKGVGTREAGDAKNVKGTDGEQEKIDGREKASSWILANGGGKNAGIRESYVESLAL